MIYFVTVNYYSTELLRTMLQSLTGSGDRGYQVVIVNNSPDDRTVEEFAQPESITVIPAPRNLGFGGGCNLGINWVYARDPQAVVWLFNPDAELIPGAMAYVRACLAADPAIAILGTRIEDMAGNLWFSRGTFNPWTGALKHRGARAESDRTQPRTLPSRWVSGCSMMFNLAQMTAPPQFDEQFFLDYEDADICERYYQHGDRVAVTQAVLVRHQVSAITHRNLGKKFRHATFSKLYFLWKHGTPLALGLNLAYMPLKMLWFLVRNPAIAQGRWQGWCDFWNWWQGRSRRECPAPHPEP